MFGRSEHLTTFFHGTRMFKQGWNQLSLAGQKNHQIDYFGCFACFFFSSVFLSCSSGNDGPLWKILGANIWSLAQYVGRHLRTRKMAAGGSF